MNIVTVTIKESDLMELLGAIEYIFDNSINPLSNPLEVGFRHSPLTTQEKLKRYENASASVAMLAKQALILLSSYTKSEQKI